MSLESLFEEEEEEEHPVPTRSPIKPQLPLPPLLIARHHIANPLNLKTPPLNQTLKSTTQSNMPLAYLQRYPELRAQLDAQLRTSYYTKIDFNNFLDGPGVGIQVPQHIDIYVRTWDSQEFKDRWEEDDQESYRKNRDFITAFNDKVKGWVNEEKKKLEVEGGGEQEVKKMQDEEK